MSSYDPSSRAASRAPSAAPRFLSRLESVPSGISDSVDARSTTGMDVDDEVFADDAEGEGSIFPPALLAPSADENDLDDLRRLTRAWVRERGTPGVLPWEGDVLDALLDKLEQQGNMISTLRSDPTTSGDEHFRLVLVQTEMERAKFLVRSYVRTRLHKIEKYAQHILATPGLQSNLSGAELVHCRKYADLVETHYTHSVLDSLPEWLRRLDDSNSGVSMVQKPNLAAPVLVYCRKDCGEIPLERGEVAVLAQGTTHLLRYDLVDRWIALGWAEVL